jgi:hypothetical protein
MKKNNVLDKAMENATGIPKASKNKKTMTTTSI